MGGGEDRNVQYIPLASIAPSISLFLCYELSSSLLLVLWAYLPISCIQSRYLSSYFLSLSLIISEYNQSKMYLLLLLGSTNLLFSLTWPISFSLLLCCSVFLSLLLFISTYNLNKMNTQILSRKCNHPISLSLFPALFLCRPLSFYFTIRAR